MKYLKTFEGLFDIFKSKKNIGDIIVSAPSKEIIVIGEDMDINYHYNNDSFGFSNPVMRKDDPVTRDIMKFKKYTIEDYFKIDPENIVKIYRHMMNKIDLHSCRKIIEIWKQKLPDLKIHLETDKYNL